MCEYGALGLHLGVKFGGLGLGSGDGSVGCVWQLGIGTVVAAAESDLVDLLWVGLSGHDGFIFLTLEIHGPN